jgi:hypothetical protein
MVPKQEGGSLSYCRAGNGSDVYAYRSVFGGWEVHHKDGYLHCVSREQFRNVLESLRKAGQAVPQSAIDRIEREIKEAA